MREPILSRRAYTCGVASRGTILVVDDDPAIRALIRRMLSGGFDVLAAEDGAEGILMACAWRPDLIILDVAMPGMDGHAVVAALRRKGRTSGIPIMVLSDLTELESAERSLEAGADLYATKAFELARLERMVEGILAPRRPAGNCEVPWRRQTSDSHTPEDDTAVRTSLRK